MTTLYFIRHGESESNRRSIFTGHLDVPLTDIGLKQAECTARFLQDIPLDAVYSSDLVRASETGRLVAQSHGLPLVTSRGFREINGGLWEGQPYEKRCDREACRVWKEQIGLSRCPQGESVAELQKRVYEAVLEVCRAYPDGTVCITTHALALRTLEALFSDIPLEKLHTVPWVSNASVTVAQVDSEGKGRILKRDLCDHLKDFTTRLADV